MLFAYVVCALFVAEVYSYDPFLFGDDTQSETGHHSRNPEIIYRPRHHEIQYRPRHHGRVHHPRRPHLPAQDQKYEPELLGGPVYPNGPFYPPIGPFYPPIGPVYPPTEPKQYKKYEPGHHHLKHVEPVQRPNKPVGHKQHKPKHESRDAEADQKVHEIYRIVVRAHNNIVNDPRKQYDMVDDIVDSIYGDKEAERNVQEFMRLNQDGELRYHQVKQEVSNLLNDLSEAEDSDRAGKLSHIEDEINKLVTGFYNEIVHSQRKRLGFIKFVIDSAVGDRAARKRLNKIYKKYPEDTIELNDAIAEAQGIIYDVRALYNDALSAREVAEEVKGYALDVELGNE